MIYFFSFCLLSAFNIFVFKLPLFMSQCCLFLYLYFLCFLYLCIVSCLHLPNSDPLTQISHEPHYRQSSTTNKNFSSLYPLFFFFFVFSPVTCLCPTATPRHFSLFPIIMSNYRSTISTLSIYHSISFMSFIYIMQGSKSARATNTVTKPKTQNKKKNTNSSVQRFSRNTSTKSVQ